MPPSASVSRPRSPGSPVPTTCVPVCGGCAARVRLAARGGASYAGFSTPDNGVVVDLSALKGITVKSNGTAVVGAGARLIDLYAALAAHGRALPPGSCPTVGVAGSTLGGGIGVVARAYGLTCDHLTGATVVTADGARTRSTATMTRTSSGRCAEVVAATVASSPASPSVRCRRPPSRSSRCAFRRRVRLGSCARGPRGWTRRRLSSLCAVTAAAAPTNRVTGTWTGSAAALRGHLASLITAVGAAPTSRTTHTYGYLAAMKISPVVSTRASPGAAQPVGSLSGPRRGCWSTRSRRRPPTG